jgi:hypothetical protein
MSDSPAKEIKREIPEVADPVACAEFQKHLPELLGEGSPNIEGHPHIKSCPNCAALVRDLESIAEAARELLPVYDPSPDLWSQIQTAMKQDAPPVSADGHKPK